MDDSLRDLVYGLLESMHGSLNEWIEERNQRKETGEIFTPTEEDPLLSLLESSLHEAYLPIDNNASNDLSTQTPSFPIEPKEENIDNHQSLPHDYQISASEFMRDENMVKEEEMDDENKEEIIANSHPISLDLLDQNSGMGDDVNDSLDEAPFNEDQTALRTMQPSDVMDFHMNFDDEISGDNDQSLAEKNSFNEVSMSNSHMNETTEPEIDGKVRGLSANDVIDNEKDTEDTIDRSTDTPTDTSDSVRNQKKKISSRHMSRPMQYSESMDSDGDDGPSMKESRSQSLRKSSSKRKSYNGEEESEDVVKKRRVSKTNETELACPECEHRNHTVKAWVDHLRKKHSTTPTLAGLALLCECGNESVSDAHVRLTNHRNTTVIRKREGPIRRIDDTKMTPMTPATIKCVLCEVYPTTACGYVSHLDRHHKSTLAKNGVYLECSCGLKIRSSSYREHADECNPRQFTLHKLDDK